MKKRRRVRALCCFLALAITALLALAAPFLRAGMGQREAALPPGVRAAKRQLITVWVADGLPGVSAWLRGQAAAYAKIREGAAVWLRTASRADVAALEDAPPDLLVFRAETPVLPWTLRPLALTAEAALPAAGAWDGRRLAAPLCLSGYVLASCGEQALTPAPRSLFGVAASPPPASPAPPAGEVIWPEAPAADTAFGALALGAMGAPAGARLVDAAALPGLLQRREIAAALLTVQQARPLQAAGMALEPVAASPATDRVMYAALTERASDAAADFLDYLLSETAQRALADQALVSPRADLRLYGPDRPLLSALEAALSGGWLAPAFYWAEEGAETCDIARTLYLSGQSPAGLLER